MSTFWIINGAILALFLYGIWVYNSLIMRRNQVKNIYASVDTQLKKRYDLLPNLVSSIKQYLTHERSLLERITYLRAQALNSTNPNDTFELNLELSKALGAIKVAIEAYPTLNANENIMHLQSTLVDIEDQISASRRAYNASVLSYNNCCDMFPTNLVAKVFGFKSECFFKTDESQKIVPNVDTLFKNQ